MSTPNHRSRALSTDNDGWFFAGLTSSFPDLASSTSTNFTQKLKLSDQIPCAQNDSSADVTRIPAVKIFEFPQTDTPQPQPAELTPDQALTFVGLQNQVLVFQYKTKFHAIDHQCPHRSYPLSKGTVNDIEDFGVVFSAGITCPKHGWAFDLVTGESDRGAYKLGVWRVQLRELRVLMEESGVDDGVQEVWVKQR